MLFDDEFLDSISGNPINSVLEICRRVQEQVGENPDGWIDNDYELLIEAFALLQSMEDGELIESPVYPPDVVGELNRDCSSIYSYINNLEASYKAEASKLKFDSLKAKFTTSLKDGFVYEFSQGDLDRVQILLNQLRESISSSTQFEADHQRRLLARLEKLQAELHKKMSNLDMLYGLVGDAGVVIGKFGKDVKPIVDRLREIVEIVWRTQARAEELPSDVPFPKLEDNPDQTEIV